MSDTDEQFVQQVKSGPGRILKAARDEAGMSLQDVAAELHLRVSIVEALEREDYSEFSSEVFLKGYFRSYCRLVNLHETRMVDLLVAQLNGLKADQLEIEREQAASRGKRGLGVVTGIVLALVLVLALFAAYVFLPMSAETTSPLDEGQAASEALGLPMQQAQDKPLPAATQPPASDGQPKTQAPSPISNKQPAPAVDGAVVDEANAQGAESTQVGAEQAQTMEVKLAPPGEVDGSSNRVGNEPTESDPPTDALSVTADALTPGFTAEFSGDCWLKVTDGAGRTLFANMQRAGQRVVYSGTGPFTFVLGDARVVRLQHNGSSVDLKPLTGGNNRAEFTLGGA